MMKHYLTMTIKKMSGLLGKIFHFRVRLGKVQDEPRTADDAN